MTRAEPPHTGGAITAEGGASIGLVSTPDPPAEATYDVVPLPPPLIYIAGLALGGIIDLVRPTSGPPWPIAVAIAVLGALAWLVLNGWAVMRFKRAGTTLIPLKPSTALVVDGPYRFSRNPIYLGMAALYVGLAVVLGLMWALLLLPLVLVAVDRLAIAREEPYLERRFGPDYIAYKHRVRRWI
jgi:protein-S-isoprenylcysteine O-methyltransferase Ste14